MCVSNNMFTHTHTHSCVYMVWFWFSFVKWNINFLWFFKNKSVVLFNSYLGDKGLHTLFKGINL